MQVDADLCGGNISVVGQHGRTVELRLRSDNAANILQWFHFRVNASPHEDVRLVIANASDATFAHGFLGYQAFASYDLDRFFRVPTAIEDGRRLVLHHRPERDTTYYSYFGAYPLERGDALLGAAKRSPEARVVTFGESLEGRPLSLVVFGKERPGKRRIWLVGRQHPGETMGSWFVEGAIGRLLAEDDPLTSALLGEAVVYVVPNLNPDGSTRGNFRTNAAGRDLNREWLTPGEGTSPEILALRRTMEHAGADLFLDVHGDEHAESAFAIGCEGNPRWSERLYHLERRFVEDLGRRDASFSATLDYGADDPGKGDLRIGNNWVGDRFDCLSLTIEMPFKAGPHRGGFGPERAVELGRVSLESVLQSLGALR